MINKGEIKELFKNENYIDIINIFKREYKNMVIEFAKKHNIYTDNSTEVEELILIITSTFPQYEGYMSTISKIITSQDFTIGEEINYMLDNYNYIKEALT